MKYEVTITAVGSLARNFLENNNSIILLDEGLRPNLSDMVVQHTNSTMKGDIKVGDSLTVGQSDFKVVQVGEVANKTLKKEGHCTLVFNSEGSMPGQIILKGPVMPRTRVGDKITFA
jgi:PTS system glucitol/sorbitol-specific IIA component